MKEEGITVYHFYSKCISFKKLKRAWRKCVVHAYNSYYNDFSNYHVVVLSLHNLKDDKCVQSVYLTFENLIELNV